MPSGLHPVNASRQFSSAFLLSPDCEETNDTPANAGWEYMFQRASNTRPVPQLRRATR
jgi:hypothetical protein